MNFADQTTAGDELTDWLAAATGHALRCSWRPVVRRSRTKRSPGAVPC
jgi:hypothetical protein